MPYVRYDVFAEPKTRTNRKPPKRKAESDNMITRSLLVQKIKPPESNFFQQHCDRILPQFRTKANTPLKDEHPENQYEEKGNIDPSN